MVLDRCPAQPDLIVELAGGEDIVAGQADVAMDPSRLPDADPGSEGDQRCRLVARHAINEEPGVLKGLPPALDFGLGQEHGVRGVHDPSRLISSVGFEAGHDRRGHAVDRRHVIAALASRQFVAVARGLGHQRMELVLRDRPASGAIHIGHSKRGRQGLRRIDLPSHLEPEPGERTQVRIAGGVDEGASLDPPEPSLRGDEDRPDPAIDHVRVLERGMEEDLHSRIGDQSLPGDLEVFRDIGDARTRAVRIRSLEDRTEGAQSGDDLVRDPAHDLDRLLARRPEPVERVEDGGARSAQERHLLDEHDRGAAPGRGDGGGRPSRAGADHADIGLGDGRHVAGPAGRHRRVPCGGGLGFRVIMTRPRPGRAPRTSPHQP